MTVGELVAKLSQFNPLAEVVVMSSHDDGDDLMDWNIFNVNDSWSRKLDGDMISLEITFDQRPEYFAGAARKTTAEDTGMEPSPTPWEVSKTSNGSIYIKDAEGRTLAIIGKSQIDWANAHYIVHLANDDHNV